MVSFLVSTSPPYKRNRILTPSVGAPFIYLCCKEKGVLILSSPIPCGYEIVPTFLFECEIAIKPVVAISAEQHIVVFPPIEIVIAPKTLE